MRDRENLFAKILKWCYNSITNTVYLMSFLTVEKRFLSSLLCYRRVCVSLIREFVSWAKKNCFYSDFICFFAIRKIGVIARNCQYICFKSGWRHNDCGFGTFGINYCCLSKIILIHIKHLKCFVLNTLLLKFNT